MVLRLTFCPTDLAPFSPGGRDEKRKHDGNCNMTPRLKQPISTGLRALVHLVRSVFCSGWAMPCQPGCWGIGPGAALSGKGPSTRCC